MILWSDRQKDFPPFLTHFFDRPSYIEEGARGVENRHESPFLKAQTFLGLSHGFGEVFVRMNSLFCECGITTYRLCKVAVQYTILRDKARTIREKIF